MMKISQQSTPAYQQNIRLGNPGRSAKYKTWQPGTIRKIWGLCTRDYQQTLVLGYSGLWWKYGSRAPQPISEIRGLDSQDYDENMVAEHPADQQNTRLRKRRVSSKYETWVPRTIVKIWQLSTPDHKQNIGSGTYRYSSIEVKNERIGLDKLALGAGLLWIYWL